MTTRVFVDQFEAEQTLSVSGGAHHHLARVLRKRRGDKLELFDGKGKFVEAVILSISKQESLVNVGASICEQEVSPIRLTLFQSLSKGERMEYAIQKAVELGVAEISPIVTDRCDVRVDRHRLEKKQQRWQQIIVSACEQSGQNLMPKLNVAISFKDCLESNKQHWQNTKHAALILSPKGDSLGKLEIGSSLRDGTVIVGPEGGFTEEEILFAEGSGAQGWRLGPRILRTETAGVAALSVLQYKAGVF